MRIRGLERATVRSTGTKAPVGLWFARGWWSLGTSTGRIAVKYDASACHFNMDTGCVELLLRDGRKISIDCIGVEDALDVTMAQQSET